MAKPKSSDPHIETFNALVKETRALRKLEAAHPKLIAELRGLENSLEKLTEQLKKSVRKFAVIGETVTVIDGATGSVRVVGAMGTPIYDYDEFAMAFKYDQRIVGKVRAIDSKKVAALVELGEIKPEELGQIGQNNRKELTPRVIVRVE